MSKSFVIGLLLMALILAACAPEGTSVQATAPAATALPATPSIATPVSQSTATKQPGCTVTTRKPGLDPTQESPIPPVDESDWSIGPQDAYVTIIEYGDFQ
jgi:hypothetical protein